MFADDGKLWSVIQIEFDEESLQTNLNRLEKLSQDWLWPFNVTKCNIQQSEERSTRTRTALVARELTHYKVDIVALSETRFSEKGQLEEVGAGYTFFWSGRHRAERQDAGVAFVIRNDNVGLPPPLPQGISDRLMSPSLPLREEGFVTIISAYAPPILFQ
ncbi:hypothetical protein SprV_0702275500 [Sparganum proliferum]